MTDDSGECSPPLAQSQLGPGLYRVHFDTQSYYISQGHSQPHYPYVEVSLLCVYIIQTCTHNVNCECDMHILVNCMYNYINMYTGCKYVAVIL